MIKFVGGLMALALLTTPGLAAEPVITAEERVLTDQALARGELMQRLDRAAWVGTDAMLAKLRKADLNNVRGWIVELDQAGETVRFYGLAEDKPYWIFTADVRKGAVAGTKVVSEADRTPPTEAQTRMIAAVNLARATASKEKLAACGPRFNSLAIPPASPDAPIDVYLMTAQTKSRVYPFGGHYKLTVNRDNTVTSRPFARSCLEMSSAPQDGKTPAALFVSHLLDPVPTEIHVFTSLAARMPVGVGTVTNDAVWFVENGKIRKLK